MSDLITTPTITAPNLNPTTLPAGALAGTQDEFLKLFMAQLENQDPLNPQNGADMVAQLAQFSSVEQATESNQHLSDLVTAQNAASSASMANLVGRNCNAATGDFTLDRGGAVPPIQVSSTSPMTGASVVITDTGGKELRRIAIPDGSSSADVAWDGNAADGTAVPPGSYHVAVDPGTSSSAITAQWHARVDAVELSGGTTQIRMGGVLLSPGAIQTIGLTAATTTATPAATASISPTIPTSLANPGTTL